MELCKEMQELITSFSKISSQCNIVLRENEVFKKKIDDLGGLADQLKVENENLKKEMFKKQDIIELMHQQLSVIPSLKEESSKNLRDYENVKEKLSGKEKEIDRLEQKHLDDIKFLKQDIEEDKKKRTFLESKRVQELEEFYKQAQSTEISSLLKKMESEKKLLMDQLEEKNELIRSLNAENRKEIEKLKVQLYNARMTDVEASSNSLSTEFYRKKILSLQEHYEKQINELTGTCNTIGVQSPTPKSPSPRKLISLVPKSPLAKSLPSPKAKSALSTEQESAKFKTPITPKLKSAVQLSSKLSSKPYESPKQMVDKTLIASIMKSKKKKVTFQVPESPKRNDTSDVNSEVSSENQTHLNNGSFLREDFWNNLSEENFNQSPVKVTPDPRKQMKQGKRFKFSNCSSTKHGEVPEFGHFQTIDENNFEDNQAIPQRKNLDKSGMKRKLFDEPLGPQTF